ncbi:MAG: selenide, water dikinase SelD [Pseudomonadales bacterium]|nr:selenide, water dikinase SelD [Pseudomonadales bacterium]
MKAISPTVKHLVLLGGGHSHLAVLRQFGMRPVPGLTITLISRDVVTPYSGSLPGYLAGNISFADMHIDLRPLAQFANARLIQSEVTEIDLTRKRITLAGRPDIPFDILSLNIGSKPNAERIAGAAEHATAVKPIDTFLSQWQTWREQIRNRLAAGNNYTMAIVGGGPASVEIAFATQYRIAKELELDISSDQRLKILIISADEDILSLHNSKVRQFASDELRRRNIELQLGKLVVEFKAGEVLFSSGASVAADAIVYATGASLPEWPFDCGLARSDDGFISVTPTLQTTSHDFVFAAGDAATVINEARPKSGVYAVRQGKVLANNLRRFATQKSLQTYFPQRQALALMSMGDGKAIASRGDLFLQGRTMGRLKHQIDSRFVKKFSRLPEMPAELQIEKGLVDGATEAQLKQHAMRCAGCGAKLSSDVLSDVLNELELQQHADILHTAGGIEDASQIKLADGRLLLQSVDYLKSFVNDPWLFARIASIHCMSDIHAMGIQPHSALAVVGLPFASKRYSRQQLREVMQGCAQELNAAGCSLVGGHSAESEELQFGLCVNGFAEDQTVLSKDQAQADDVIILTKPLGTGTLLAADMRHLAKHTWMQQAFACMLQSNADASQLIVAHGANACTDITGFGLAGHLLELIEASGCSARIELDKIAAIPGAADCLEAQIFSSLHNDNKLVQQHLSNYEAHATTSNYELLFDPQTAGGLLLTLPRANATACLSALHEAGYAAAAIIGDIQPLENGVSTISID